MFASILTCWIRAPFEIAQKAFYADQKFPSEIRQGYRSIRHAFFSLLRDNPYSLLKNSYPTMLGTIVQTSMLFTLYDYLNETFAFPHDQLEMPRAPYKTLYIFISTITAAFFSYPFFGPVRYMIEH